MSLQRYNGDSWRVVIYAGTKPNGQPKQVTRKVGEAGISEREAKRLAPAVEAELRAELEVEQAKHGTIGELIDEWLRLKITQGRSPVTIDGYRHITSKIRDRFGSTPVDRLTGRDIDRWYTELVQNGTGIPTVQHYHRVLHGMLRQAHKWEMVDSVATAKASPPSPTKTKVKPPTPAAFATAIAQLPESDFRRMLELTALTGLRRGEMLGLVWGDVHGGRLNVERAVKQVRGESAPSYGPTKTKASRSILLSPTAALVLAEQSGWVASVVLDGQIDPRLPVFPDIAADATGSTPRRPAWLSATWRAQRAKIGLPDVRIHDLRHLNATTLMQNGISVVQVAAIEGHSRPSITTDVYGHATNEQEAEAAAVLDHHIGALLRSPAIPEHTSHEEDYHDRDDDNAA